LTSWSNFTFRKGLILAHDLLVTGAAVIVAFYLRFEEPGLAERAPLLSVLLPAFVAYSLVVFLAFGLNKAKWRFVSLHDLISITKVASVLAITLLAIDYWLLAPNMLGTYFFGRITILLYWLLEIVFLAGPRIAYRYFRYTRTRRHARTNQLEPTLVLGRAADAEVLLRGVESGAIRNIEPVGLLSPSRNDHFQSVRRIDVLGDLEDLEHVVAGLAAHGVKISRLILTQTALVPEAKPESILIRARRLGLTVNRLMPIEEADSVRLAPVAVEELLLRPTVKIDYKRIESLVKGKAALVTGGGGSIGREICDRLVTSGLTRLLIIENSEPALHAVLEALKGKRNDAEIVGRIGDMRDRDRLMRLVAEFRPDIVFHAAALKHVPLLERDWEEAIKTNVFGSINIADAAVAAGARAMVMISTDKAIEPVSMLGATKRFAEMYCQALDADLTSRAGGGEVPATRLISVRFGNVLASNGSVVPKFKAQIEAGGPVTVTHPDMVRYFMTIREACNLVVTAASHALGENRTDVAVYVLNMGQPVRIVELAERMIRLSGLEPGFDIEIVYSGLRPGERLHEILFAREEPSVEIGIDGVVAARPVGHSMASIRQRLEALSRAVENEDFAAICRILGVQSESCETGGG